MTNMVFEKWFLLAFVWLSISLQAKTASVDSNKHHAGSHERVLGGDHRKLSEKEHSEGDHHGDYDYDHDAFLGVDDAREFDQLPPEESKARLGKIVDRIDSNEDGYVTLDEMRDWIRFTQQRYISEDVDRQWNQHNVDNKETMSWEEYRTLVYGFLDEDLSDGHEDEDTISYQNMEGRDKKRWHTADEDKDGTLNKLEFKHFLHPEESDHMRDIVVSETLDDIDKDGDGLISLEEYVGDMFRGDGDESTEPDWVKTERESFNEVRDENGDGFMDAEEVKKWILPSDYDHTEAEAKHLIYESDVDGDAKLSKEEIMEKYDLFVGSQATDFGEALTRHDEF